MAVAGICVKVIAFSLIHINDQASHIFKSMDDTKLGSVVNTQKDNDKLQQDINKMVD